MIKLIICLILLCAPVVAVASWFYGAVDSGGAPPAGSFSVLADEDIATLSLSSTDTWEAIDLDTAYGTLPSPASAVVLVACNPDGSDYAFGVRENGDTDYTLVDNLIARNKTYVYAKPDSGNQIQIYRGNANIEVHLVGYFDSASTWQASPVDVTPGTINSWEDVDLSAYTSGGEVFAVFEVVSINTRSASFRYNGDTGFTARSSYSEGHFWAVMGLDGSDIVEVNIENATDTTVYLVGFINVGTVRTTASSDLVTGTTYGTFESITVPDTGHDSAVLFFYGVSKAYDVRETSGTSSPDMYDDTEGCNYGMVAVDGSDQADLKVEDSSIAVYCVGYFD